MKSPKEQALERAIIKKAAGKPAEAVKLLFSDPEVQALQDYANTVSIRRLRYNDHGPVHMRKVALNALTLLDLLHTADISLNLEAEEIGSFEDSKTAVVIASLLHDVGMTIGREGHQDMGIVIALPIIDRILESLYDTGIEKRVILRSMILEGIVGHMGTQKIHSLESGVVLIADGCDMEQGRARIPMSMGTESKVGDIHKYSSFAVKKVALESGKEKPIRITVTMTESVGFFQVEEVLFTKIDASPVKPYIELYAGIEGEELKHYL